MNSNLSQALKLADAIMDLPIEDHEQSDVGTQKIYINKISKLADSFLDCARKLRDPELTKKLYDMDVLPEFFLEALILKEQLRLIIEYLRKMSENPDYPEICYQNKESKEEKVSVTLIMSGFFMFFLFATVNALCLQVWHIKFDWDLSMSIASVIAFSPVVWYFFMRPYHFFKKGEYVYSEKGKPDVKIVLKDNPIKFIWMFKRELLIGIFIVVSLTYGIAKVLYTTFINIYSILR